MGGTWEFQGKLLFDSECLWLTGYKPCEPIGGAESIVWMYRGSLTPDGDSMTRNLGTTVVGPCEWTEPACG